jgi:hypothetical protein
MFGSTQSEEKPLDEDTIRDLLDMYHSVPVIKVARKSFLSMTLGEPFTFSIPAIGLESNKDMEKIISAFWMPWLRTVYDWVKLFGICPYYFKKTKGEKPHMIPVVPDIQLGYITVVVNTAHELEYKWYWSHGTHTEQETKMLWVITEDHPSCSGQLNSPLVSLLANYRSLKKLQKSQDIACTQAARPVHLMEYTPNARTANNDELTHLVADFGKAAGITKARRDQMRNQEIRVKTAELYKQLQETHNANTVNSTVSQTLWTDTSAQVLEEMDNGFASRVVALRPDFHYKAAQAPVLVADFYAAESQFNLMAAAIMDFSMELLQPAGQSRSQNVEGAQQFENNRIQETTSFFRAILQPALVIAYRDQFSETMEMAHNWRLSKLKGDPNNAAVLFPELDVVVDLSGSTVNGYDDMRAMWYDGIMTQKDFAETVYKQRNMPSEQIVTLPYPDGVPKERLVRPEKDDAEKKTKPPAHKKTKTKAKK